MKLHTLFHQPMMKTAFLTLLFSGLLAVTNAYAVCCGPVCGGPIGGTCGDCTTTNAYCGYGPCNIFGCNCDGGCRTGRCDQLNGSSESTQDKFSEIDQDASGTISFEEASAWLLQNGKSEEELADLQGSLDAMDTNENRVIDPAEFDDDLKPSETDTTNEGA